MILEPVDDEDPRTLYFVEVCDALWSPLDRLSAAWDDLLMRHIACDVGSGKVDCAATDANRKLLAAGKTVRVFQGTQVKQSGLFRIAGETTDEAGNSTINLTWCDALEYLAGGMADPNPGSLGDLGSKVFDQRGGFVSTAILGYVKANIGEDARPELRAPGLVLGPDPLGGVWLETPAAARFDNLLEFLANLALPNGVVFTVDTQDRAQVFNVRQVEDLSKSVVFSAQSFNLGAGNWSRTAPKATRITVRGPGEPQLIFEVTTPESLRQEQVWGRVFRDILSSDTLVQADPAVYQGEAYNTATVALTRASLQAEAERKLSELGETWSAQYVVLDSGPFLFGRDYFLGDIIGVQPAGWDEPLAFPVREYVESVSVQSGRRIQPVIGDYGSTSGLPSSFNTKQLVATVSRLQTRR